MTYKHFYSNLFERYTGSKQLRGIWYHGTSTKYLQSILSQGLLPNPPEKSWDVDPDASQTTYDRTTYGGIYVTKNLLTAYSAAWRTARKTNGNRLIVMLDLQSKSLIADEDDITFHLNPYHETNALWYFKLLKYGSEYPEYITDMEKEKEKWANSVVSKLKEYYDITNVNVLRILKQYLLNEGFEAIVTRTASYSTDKYLWHRNWDVRNTYSEDIPKLPTSKEGELIFRNFVNKLTKLLKFLVNKDLFAPKGRSLKPIRFSGSNKIVCIIELIEFRDEKAKIKIHYGSLPDDFRQQYKTRIGDLPDDMIIKESIIDSFELDNHYVEVFKNPTSKELKSCIEHGQFGAFLQNNDIYVFNRMRAYHQSIRSRNKQILDQSLSLLVWVETDGYSVLVTDNNERTKWHNNPSTEEYIRNHPFFKNKIKDILYFNQDIVGDWSML